MRKPALVLVLFLLAACGNNPGTAARPTATFPLIHATATATPFPHWVAGEAIDTDKWEITLSRPRIVPGFAPAPGNAVLVMDIQMMNISNDVQYANELYFSCRGEDGTKFGYGTADGVVDFSGNVVEGGLAKGQLAFEVLATEKQFNVFFDDFNYLLTWDIGVP